MNLNFLSLGIVATFRGRYKTQRTIVSFGALSAVFTGMTFGYGYLIGPGKLFPLFVSLLGSAEAFLSLAALVVFTLMLLIQPLELAQARIDGVASASAALAQGADGRGVFLLHHTIRLVTQPYLAFLVAGLALHHSRHSVMTLAQAGSAFALTAPFFMGYGLGWSACLWRRIAPDNRLLRRMWAVGLVATTILAAGVAVAYSVTIPWRCGAALLGLAASFQLTRVLQKQPGASTVFLGHGATPSVLSRRVQRIFGRIDVYDVSIVFGLGCASALIREEVVSVFALVAVALVGSIVSATRHGQRAAEDPVEFFVCWAGGASPLVWIANRAARFVLATAIILIAAAAGAGASARMLIAPLVFTVVFGAIVFWVTLLLHLFQGVFDRNTRNLRVSPIVRLIVFGASGVLGSLSIGHVVVGTMVARAVVWILSASSFGILTLLTQLLPHHNNNMI